MFFQNNCPICSSSKINTFLRREGVPVHQNLVIYEQRSAELIMRGDLNIAYCNDCGFVFNQTFDSSRLMYGEDYDNTQTYSPFFNKHIEELVGYLIVGKGIRNCRIVEVGCGKGLFLRKLVEADASGNVGYGFDPSYTGPGIDVGGRLKFEKRYYGPDDVNIAADVVICRHVIEHIPDPLAFLSTIRQAIVNSNRGKMFLETPCVEWILYNRVIWDFFYEHCSYFSADSLTTALAASGFKMESIRKVFEGQYLWVEAAVSNQKSEIKGKSGLIDQLARQFAMSEHGIRKNLSDKIRTLSLKGKVALWGAGAKGVTLANLVDPDRKWIACVVDLNPKKQGHYIPGTGHPIIGYQELANYGVKTAILMNPNYHQENVALVQASQLDVELVDLMNLI